MKHCDSSLLKTRDQEEQNGPTAHCSRALKVKTFTNCVLPRHCSVWIAWEISQRRKRILWAARLLYVITALCNLFLLFDCFVPCVLFCSETIVSLAYHVGLRVCWSPCGHSRRLRVTKVRYTLSLVFCFFFLRCRAVVESTKVLTCSWIAYDFESHSPTPFRADPRSRGWQKSGHWSVLLRELSSFQSCEMAFSTNSFTLWQYKKSADDFRSCARA